MRHRRHRLAVLGACLTVIPLLMVGAASPALADSDNLPTVDLSALQRLSPTTEITFPFVTTHEAGVYLMPTLGQCFPDSVAFGQVRYNGDTGKTERLDVLAYVAMGCDTAQRSMFVEYQILQNGLLHKRDSEYCSGNCTTADTDGINTPAGRFTCQRTATLSCSGIWQLRYEWVATGILPGFPAYVADHNCTYSQIGAVVRCIGYTGKVRLA